MNERIATQVGRNIRAVRIAKGFTQGLLAERCNFKFAYIQDVEGGQLDITLVKAYRIAGALGCPVAQLFRELGG